MEGLSGRAFNMGGGVNNAVSLRELIDLVAQTIGARPALRWEDWRAADQRYYVSDVGSFSRATGWRPRTSVKQGLASLLEWCKARRSEAPARAPEIRDAAGEATASGGRW
jgi:CDP-paratose 2-epimerase